jgi:hypothetical protein
MPVATTLVGRVDVLPRCPDVAQPRKRGLTVPFGQHDLAAGGQQPAAARLAVAALGLGERTPQPLRPASAWMAVPPPELAGLPSSIQGDRQAMDAFVRMNAGVMAPEEFFAGAAVAASTG